jgi:aminopeptidase N
VKDQIRVSLTQTAFGQAEGVADVQPWVMPVCLETRGDATADACHVLDSRTMSIDLPGCSRWVVGNRGAEGYYRTSHGRDALQRLIRANAELAADERLMLVADQWALVRTGSAGLEPFLMVARALAGDAREPAIVTALGGRLQFIREYLTTERTQPAFERWVREQFGPTLRASRVLQAETETQRARRAALLGIVGAVGRDPELIAHATQSVRAYLSGKPAPSIPPELLDAYVGLAALSGRPVLYEQFRAQISAATTPEERYRFLYALAAFRDESLIKRTIEYALSDQVRAQDRASLLVRILANPAARPIAWQTIQDRWAELQSGLGAFGGTIRIIGGLGAFCDTRAAADIKQFFSRHPVPGSQRALAQTLESIATCARIADAQRPLLMSAVQPRP